ncbi:hypothetical protein NSR02_07090 [Bacillus sp. FSL W8-1122]
MADFNERLLKEIARLRTLQGIGIKTERVSMSLELLRFIRNSELSISFDKGLEQENEWILRNEEID